MTKEHTVNQTAWLNRKVRLPTGRKGIVTAVAYDRLTVHYTDAEGGEVSIHPNLLDTIDGPRPTP